jgi:hypothetical protein
MEYLAVRTPLWTRCASVNFTFSEAKGAKFGAGGANGNHFGMSGRIVGSGYLIGPFANDTAIVYNDGAKRAAAEFGDALFGEGNRPPHEIIAIHGGSILREFPSNYAIGSHIPIQTARCRLSAIHDGITLASVINTF